jgi:hypothetical protein
MAKREVIILVALGLVVLYGAYSFLFTGGGSAVAPGMSPDERKRLTDYVESSRGNLDDVKLTDIEMYRISRAEKPWIGDPFYKRIAPTASEEPEEEELIFEAGDEEVPTFVYSGFIQLGNTRYAIVNGIEYSPGEELDQVGYYLTAVTPSEITIEKRNIQDELVRLITVPMEEPLQLF